MREPRPQVSEELQNERALIFEQWNRLTRAERRSKEGRYRKAELEAEYLRRENAILMERLEASGGCSP